MLHLKFSFMKVSFKVFGVAVIISSLLLIAGCKDEDPAPENVPELITKVILNFTPTGGGAVVSASATDPDGDGPQNLVLDGPINLTTGTSYTLSIDLINGLYSVGQDGYDISAEVREEGDEHQLFFGWTDGDFSAPTGAGNINGTGVVNYEDEDTNGRPIGLITSWTTSATTRLGRNFRVLLKHQPGIKSNTSVSADGETDLDITFFPLNIN